jgi:hypothetical protein
MTETRTVHGQADPGAEPFPGAERSALTPHSVRIVPARVAMSWIRALANDWEDERERAAHPDHSNS